MSDIENIGGEVKSALPGPNRRPTVYTTGALTADLGALL